MPSHGWFVSIVLPTWINGHFRNLNWRYLSYVCIYIYKYIYIQKCVCVYVYLSIYPSLSLSIAVSKSSAHAEGELVAHLPYLRPILRREFQGISPQNHGQKYGTNVLSINHKPHEHAWTIVISTINLGKLY